MKNFFWTILTVGALMCFADVDAQSLSADTRWHWKGGTIEVEVPVREEGQQHALNLRTEKLPVVRVGFVGLGMRGPSAVDRFTYIPGVEIVALCDYEPERAVACQQYLRKTGLAPARVYSGAKGYVDLCESPDIDLVYVATDWDHHFPVAKCALENGKHTAIEVPSALNLSQCWELINLVERCRRHCMILENCCYDWFELDALNMAQQGVLGEVIYAKGAYLHNLDPFWDYYWVNREADRDSLGWRMKYNMENRGDLYATHGLGPVAQVMNIHRGDRFKTLIAMDTKSVHGKEWVEQKTGRTCNGFRNGDHTVTLMRTEQGKMVEIQHDVMSPQPYNRLYQLTGTKGFVNKYPVEGLALDAKQLKAKGHAPKVDNLTAHEYMSEEEMKAVREKYRHPIVKKYGDLGAKVGGHGGMDFFMDSRLVYCLQNGLPLDLDVYDLAEWCCLGELGSLSMDHDFAPVAFPDFTRGYWDVQKGYSHAYAEAEEEQAAEDRANGYTERQKQLVKDLHLWELYDAVQQATAPKDRARLQRRYDRACQKLHRLLQE